MVVEDLYWAYFFMILNGSTFAGKNVVGLNYLLEFQVKINRERVMSIKLAFSSIALIFQTLCYQYVSKKWWFLQTFFLITTVIATTYVQIFVPESSQYLYSKKLYKRAKFSLKRVANFNAVYMIGSIEFEKAYKFDREDE